MKQLDTEQTPGISGGSENPAKNPPVESITPICPAPLPYPQIPVGPVFHDRFDNLDDIRS